MLDTSVENVVTDIGETDFNAKFEACPVVRYSRNGGVHSVYKRISMANMAGINAYSLFTYTWASANNILNSDFEIFDSALDMRNGEGKWTHCNYDDPDVGYPRDCGKDRHVGSTWFTMPGGRFTGITCCTAHGCWRCSTAKFEPYTGTNCPVASPDPSGWTTAVELSADGQSVVTDIGAADFNAQFEACPVVRYSRNGGVFAVYKRTNLEDHVSAYNLFTHTWAEHPSNALNSDFELYDNEQDMRNGAGKWTFCNYDDPDVGFPRDCGKNGNVGGTWFSMPGGRFTMGNSAKFELYTGTNCPVAETTGFCSVRNPDLGSFSNRESCPDGGADSNIGLKISVDFAVTMAGAYGFRFGVNFGWGGVIMMDGKEMGEGYYEGARLGTAPLDLSIDLAVGMHSLVVYGAKGCCDQLSNIGFKEPGSDTWEPLTEANLRLAAQGYATYKAERAELQENVVYSLEVRAVGDSFAVMVDNANYATFKHSALTSGTIGLQTWQASMEVTTLELLRDWVSDDRTTRCTPMEVQPSIMTDSDESPLMESAAQQICGAFEASGCAGFLFRSRSAQHALDGTSVASVEFCAGDMTRTEGEAGTSEPVGWFRPAGLH